ncbi:MAG: phosphoribosylanthranilate isomerase [Myxococcales bacterium]|nr:phosphoribosylanthranilate isomerase [Myxococcales bacterium]
MVTVKICGVRTLAGAQAIATTEADYAGLLFVPGKARSINVVQAETLCAHLGNTTPVGVFMDATLETVKTIVRGLQLTIVQLHGKESPEYAKELHKEGIEIIKVFSWSGSAEYAHYGRYRDFVSYYLFDSPQPGTGTQVDVDTFFGRDLRSALDRPIWLAGGLTPENVQKSIETHGLDGVDVASGIEQSGEQNPERIAAFVAAAKKVNS